MWQNNEYVYSKGMLKRIAYSYKSIYTDGIDGLSGVITNPWVIVEYKADFDCALDAIGRGFWAGYTDDIDYRSFGRWQRIVMGDIEGDMGRMEYDPQTRGRAYGAMARFLNNE